MKWAALMLGGGLGASMRYALTVWLDARHATAFPWGTLAVNFVGDAVRDVLDPRTLREDR